MLAYEKRRFGVVLLFLCVLLQDVRSVSVKEQHLTRRFVSEQVTRKGRVSEGTTFTDQKHSLQSRRRKVMNIAFLPISDPGLTISQVTWESTQLPSDPNRLPSLNWNEESYPLHIPDSTGLLLGESVIGVDQLGEFLEVLRIYSGVSDSKVKQHHGRDLKLLSLETPNLNLDLGGILDDRPRLFLETPDVSVGLEGLLSTLAKATIGGLASQLTGGLLNPGGVNPGGLPTTSTPQMQGIQQQYQLQFSRGPWNVQSGLQVGVQAQDDPTGTFFLNPDATQQPSGVTNQDPQTVFQQTSDVYYGQGFTEGYNQGYSSGTSSGQLGTPTGALPPLSNGSPPGYNEGIVAGFTRGLQDGYYAGFQAWQTTGSMPRVGNVHRTARPLPTANSLPRALPHVSQTGGLPVELQDAQLAAFQAYESNFQRPAFDQERLAQINQGSQHPNGPNYSSQETPPTDATNSMDSQKQTKEALVHEGPVLEPDSQQRKASEDDLIGELRSRQSSLERLGETKETEESLLEEKDETIELSRTDDEEEIRIAGMSLMVAVLAFSAVLFVCILFCFLAAGCFTSRRKTKEQKEAQKLPPLKSKVSDLTEISAYMKSPTMFDSYIQPRFDHKPSQAKRVAGTKE